MHGEKKVKSFPLSFWLMSLLVGCAVFTIIRTSQIHFDDVTTTTTPELIEPIENLASSTLQGGAKDPKQVKGDKSPYRPSLIGLPDFEPCRSLQEVNAANIDEELLFWWDGQPKLCQLIRKLKGGVNHIEDPGSPAVLNLNINCTNLTHNNGLGSGNWLVGFYMARLAAAFASVHLKFECSAANYKTEVLPFLQGCYLPVTDRYPPVKDRWPQENATQHLLCGWDMKTAPIQLAALEIRDAMRHLVLSATGFERPPLSVPVNTTMFGQVSFDEVAIHFRCGDVIKMTNPRGDYALHVTPPSTKRGSRLTPSRMESSRKVLINHDFATKIKNTRKFTVTWFTCWLAVCGRTTRGPLSVFATDHQKPCHLHIHVWLLPNNRS